MNYTEFQALLKRMHPTSLKRTFEDHAHDNQATGRELLLDIVEQDEFAMDDSATDPNWIGW